MFKEPVQDTGSFIENNDRSVQWICCLHLGDTGPEFNIVMMSAS